MAKGICYARGLKLISVPILELLCVPVLLHHEEIPEDALLCPMIDARRMEVYAAVYDRALQTVRAVGADVVDASSYRDLLDARPVYFFGRRCGEMQDTDCSSQCTFSFRVSSPWRRTWDRWPRRCPRSDVFRTWPISSLFI